MSCIGIFPKIEDCEGKSLNIWVNLIFVAFCYSCVTLLIRSFICSVRRHGTEWISIWPAFYVLCSLFKSYKPECVPEKIPAVNIQVAFKATGKMNQFFQQARLRLGAGNVDQRNAEMVKWNIDQGVKRVSVNAAVYNDISTSYIAALLLVFLPPLWLSICSYRSVWEQCTEGNIWASEKRQNRKLEKLHYEMLHNSIYILYQIIWGWSNQKGFDVKMECVCMREINTYRM